MLLLVSIIVDDLVLSIEEYVVEVSDGVEIVVSSDERVDRSI